MACELCSGTEAALRSLTNELKAREEEISDLSAKFTKHKLQSKAKVTQLRQQLAEFIISENQLPDDEQSTQSKLSRVLLKLDDAETDLARSKEEAEKFKSLVSSKDTQIADHLIRIKLLEEQLELTDSVRKHSEALEKNGSSASSSSQQGDLQASVYAQLVYKDTKILELNNQILAKDRQILDLQESCRERQEVADAKSKAIQILQSQIVRMAPRDKANVSTETEPRPEPSNYLPVPAHGRNYRDNRTPSPAEDAALSSSPGRAIAIFELPRTGSPPPADPAFDEMSSFTTESALEFPDPSQASSSNRTLHDFDSFTETNSQGTASSSLLNPSSKSKKRGKKRVTWDLSEQEREQEIKDLKKQISELEASNQELSEENEELRSTIGDVEVALDDAKVLETDWELKYKLIETQAEQLSKELEDVKRENRNNALKAKAQSHSRIKDLEERLDEAASQQETSEATISELKDSLAEEETLHSKTIHEKEQYLDELDSLREALSEAEAAISGYRAENLALRDQIEDMDNANESLEEQRTNILANLDPLKETVDTSSQLIETLEGEIINLKDSVQERDSQISELVSDLEEARATADALLVQKRSLFNDADSLKEVVEASQQVIESLEMDLQIANAETDVLRAKLVDVQHETGEVAATLVKESSERKLKGKAFEAKLRVLEKHKMELAKESSENRLKWKAFDTKFRHLTQEKEALQTKLDEQSRVAESLEMQIVSWKDDSEKGAEKYHNLESHMESLKLKLEIEQDNVREMEKVNRSLLDEKTEIEAELKNFWETETDLKRQLGEAEATCDRLRAERRQWQNHCSELEASESNLIQQITSLTETVQKRDQECHSLKDRLAVLESGASEVTKEFAKELSTLRMHFNAVDKKNKDLKAENETLRKQVANSSSENARLAAQAETMETHMEKIEATYRSTVAGLTQDVESWRSGCDKQQSAVEEFQQTNQQLKDANLRLMDELKTSENALNELKEQIKLSSTVIESTSRKLEEVSQELETVKTETRIELEEFRRIHASTDTSLESLKMKLAFLCEEADIHLEPDEMESSDRMDIRFTELLDWIDSNRSLLKSRDKEIEEVRKLQKAHEEDYSALVSMISAQLPSLLPPSGSISGLVSSFKLRIETLSSEKATAVENLSQLKSDKAKLSEKTERLERAISKLREEAVKSCEGLEIMVSSKLQTLKEAGDSSETEAQLAALSKENEELKLSLYNSSAVNRDLNIAVATYQKESENSTHTSSSEVNTDGELKDLRNKHQKTILLLDETKAKYQRLEEEKQRYGAMSTEQQTASADRIEALQASCADLQQQNSKLQVLVTSTSEKQQQAQYELEEVKSQLQAKEYLQAQLQTSVESLRSENEEFKSQIVLKESKIAHMLAEASEQMVRRSSDQLLTAEAPEEIYLSPEKEEAVKKVQELTTAIEEIRVERDRLVHDRQNLCHEILALNSQIQEAEGSLEAKDIALEGLQESTAALVTQVEALKESQRTSEVAELQDIQMKLQQEKTALDERITSLEEENQLLRHCLNEAEQVAESRGVRVEELDLLCSAQKGVICKLRDQLCLMDGTLSTLKQHKEATIQDIHVQKGQLESDFSQVHSKLELMVGEATTKDKELEELRIRATQVDEAYKSLSEYYTNLQTAYAALYEQYQIVHKSAESQTSEASAVEPQKTAVADPERREVSEEKKETMKLRAKVKKLQIELGELKERSAKVSEELLDTRGTDSAEVLTAMRDQYEASLAEKQNEIDGLIQHLKAVRSSHEDKQKLKEKFESEIQDALTELRDLKVEKETVSQEVENFVAINAPMIRNLEIEVRGYSQHVHQLGDNLSLQKKDCDIGREQYETLYSAHQKLEENLQNSIETADLKLEELDTLKKMYYQLEADRSRMELENQELKRKVQQVTQGESQKNEDSANYDEVIRLLEERLEVVSLEAEEAASKLSAEEEKTAIAENDIVALKQSLKDLQLANEEREAEVLVKSNALAAAKLDESSRTDSSVQCKDEESLRDNFSSKEETVVLNAQITDLKRKIDSTSLELTEAQQEVQNLNDQLLEATAMKDTLSEELSSLKSENELLHEQLSPFQDLLAVKTLLMDKLTNLEETCDQIHAERKELMQKIDSIERQRVQCEQEKMQMQEDSSAEIAQARSSESQLRETIQTLHTQLSSCSQASERATDDESTAKIAALQLENETLTSRLEELEDQKEAEVWDLQSQITMNETTKRKLESELGEKNSELEAITSQMLDTQREYSEVRDCLEATFGISANATIEAVLSEIENVIAERLDSETKVSNAVETEKQEKSDLMSEKAELEAQLIELTEKSSSLEEEHQTALLSSSTKYGELVSNLQSKIQTLEEEISKTRSQITIDAEKHYAELETMKKSAREESEVLQLNCEETLKTAQESSSALKDLTDEAERTKEILCQLQGINPTEQSESAAAIAEKLQETLVGWKSAVESRETQFAEVQKQWEEAVQQRDAAIVALQQELQRSQQQMEETKKQDELKQQKESSVIDSELQKLRTSSSETQDAQTRIAQVLGLTESPTPERIVESVKAMHEKLVTSVDEQASFTQRIEADAGKIQELVADLASKEAAIPKLEEELKSGVSTTEELREKIATISSDVKSIADYYSLDFDDASEPDEVIEKIKSSHSERIAELNRLKEQNRDLEHENLEIRGTIQDVKLTLEETQAIAGDKDTAIASLTSEMTKLSSELTKSRELIEKWSSVLNLNQANPEVLIEETVKLCSSAVSSTSNHDEIKVFRQDIRKLQEEKTRTEAKLKEIEEENQSVKHSMESNSSDLEALKQKLSATESKNLIFSEDAENSKALCKNLEQKLAEAMDSRNKTEQALHEYQSLAESLSSELDKTKILSQQDKIQLQELKAEREIAVTKNNDYDQETETVKAQSLELGKLNTSLSEVKAENLKQTKRCGDLTQQLEETAGKYEDTKRQLAESEEERETLASQLEDCLHTERELVQKLKHAEALNSRIQSESSTAIQNRDKIIRELGEKLENLETKSDEQEMRISHLLDEVEEQTKRLGSEQSSSLVQMEELKKQLEELKLQKETVELQQTASAEDKELQTRNYSALEQQLLTLTASLDQAQKQISEYENQTKLLRQERSAERECETAEKAKLTASISKLTDEVKRWEEKWAARAESEKSGMSQMKRSLSVVQTERDEAVRRNGELLEKVTGLDRKLNNYELKLAQLEILEEKVRQSDQFVADLQGEKEKREELTEEMRDRMAEGQVEVERLTDENKMLEEKVKLLKDEVRTITSRENIQIQKMESQPLAPKGRSNRPVGPGSQSSLTSIDTTSSTVIEAPRYQQEARSSLHALLSGVGEQLPTQTDLIGVDGDFVPDNLSITLPMGPANPSSPVRSLLTRNVKTFQLWLRSQSLRRSWSPWAMRWLVLLYLLSIHYMILRCWLG